MRTLILFTAAALAAQTVAPPNDAELYYLAFLRPDPERKSIPQTEMDRIQSAHMANIQKMAKDGVLIAAGPMEDRLPTISGIFVFKTASLDEARRIAAQDPTVVERRNTIDVHPWRGPKDIGTAYAQRKKEHPGEVDKMHPYTLCLYMKGPNWTREASLAAHVQSVTNWRAQDLLAAAGRIDDDPELLGVIIFKSSSAEEVHRLVAEDGAVKSGFFQTELHRWWSAEGVLPW